MFVCPLYFVAISTPPAVLRAVNINFFFLFSKEKITVGAMPGSASRWRWRNAQGHRGQKALFPLSFLSPKLGHVGEKVKQNENVIMNLKDRRNNSKTCGNHKDFDKQ